jgi:hypothetical protein
MAVTTAPILLPADPNPNQQRYGLFNVANGPLDLPFHARNGGLQYTTNICTLPGGYAVNCTPGGVAKTFTDGLSTITGNPFVVIAETLCGTIGYSEAEWNQFAFQKLAAGEQAAVELIFSGGTSGVAPSLANNTPNATALAASTSIAGAIGLLEGWLYARYGPAGIIHIPIADAAKVLTSDYVTNVGGVWRTKSGTGISFGNYANLGVAGAAPGAGHSFWYITGQMSIWRTPDSEVFISPWDRSINLTTNQLKMYAEREYVVAYDCQVAATDITLAA